MASYQNIDELIETEAAKVHEKLARDRQIKNEDAMDVEPSIKTEKTIKAEKTDDDFYRPGSSSSNRPARIGHTRSSTDRYMNEREENNERRARRSKDIGDDDAVAARGGSDKDSANGSVRSKARSRSPRRDHRRNDRSRERQPRDSYHNSGRRGDDSYRPGDRGQDSRRGPERSRYDDDYRGGGGGPYGRRSGHGRDDRGPRDGGRGGGDRRRSPPQQPTEDERDRRTVFVQQLAARLRTKQLKDFFEQAGPVADAQIVKDRVSQRSKG